MQVRQRTNPSGERPDGLVYPCKEPAVISAQFPVRLSPTHLTLHNTVIITTLIRLSAYLFPTAVHKIIFKSQDPIIYCLLFSIFYVLLCTYQSMELFTASL